MKGKKSAYLPGLLAAAFLFAGCGSVRAEVPSASSPAPSAPVVSAAPSLAPAHPAAETVRTAEDKSAVPEASPAAAPSASPAEKRQEDREEAGSKDFEKAEPETAPASEPEGQDPEALPEESPAPTPTLPRVTKSPTDETVEEGGSCLFLAKYENAEYAVWHFVSPDGQTDMTYEAAQTAFPTMEILNGMYSNLQLRNIPYAANGWKVYCRYSNTGAGYVDTGMAQLTVIQNPAQSASASSVSQRAGFEGNWADEETGNCQILFTYRSEGSLNVGILRRNPSGTRDCWNMTTSVYRDGVLIYEDGHHWVESYSNDNSFAVSDETWNEVGSFYLENGRLHWYNGQTAEEITLLPA